MRVPCTGQVRLLHRIRVFPVSSEPEPMNAQKIAAILLIVAGALGLAYGGFSYTSDTHRTDIGPVSLQVTEKRHVNVPIWAGVGALVCGVLLLVGSRRT
jgi:uncharacterized membrane protein YdcZ (DUF606 family)